MHEEEIIQCCINCSQFFPVPLNELSEYGICLSDDIFEAYLEEIIENTPSERCLKLINQQKYHGDKDACDMFEEPEIIGAAENFSIDELKRIIISNEDDDNLDDGLIDLKKIPVDQYVSQLNSNDSTIRKKAIVNLSGLAAFKNEEAKKALLTYFRSMPPPNNLEAVHEKMDLFEKINPSGIYEEFVPLLIDELYQINSNNTTRQWISKIFKYLSHAPASLVQEPLEKMLKDKRFSYRLKQKMKAILAEDDYF